MPVNFTPLNPHFAAEASGADLRQGIDEDNAAAIERAMEKYAVLVWRDQNLDEDQQMDFTRWFGPFQLGFGKIAAGIKKTRFKHETLADMSNVDEDGVVVSRGHRRIFTTIGNMVWHSDSSFQAPAAKFSILTGHTIPSWGGETEFADMRSAYDALPQRMKDYIAPMVCEHWALHSRAMLGDTSYTDEQKAAIPPVRWPLVRIHPGSGRKTLFIGAHAREIVGMTLPEGRLLLAELLEHATQPEFVYRHHWRVGDVVMWDNRCTLHRGKRFDFSEKRELRRSTTEDSASILDAVT
jgi:alpha-ketoglutarate-dependent 2,4-dichlorophenoxyacetate dioxygenase